MKVFDHKRAKQAVDDRGLKRRWVAEKMGMAHASLNQLLVGRYQPAHDTVGRLAALLGMEAGELFTETSRRAKSA
jgi:ribosome-binding protein aMBF1 (putative translation factor)